MFGDAAGPNPDQSSSQLQPESDPLHSPIRLALRVRAKIMYAEHEDAPEVAAGAHEEYELLFNQMLAVHLPQTEWHRMENADEPMMVAYE